MQNNFVSKNEEVGLVEGKRTLPGMAHSGDMKVAYFRRHRITPTKIIQMTTTRLNGIATVISVVEKPV